MNPECSEDSEWPPEAPVDNKNEKIEDSQNNLEESAEHPPSRAKREGHKWQTEFEI